MYVRIADGLIQGLGQQNKDAMSYKILLAAQTEG